MRENIAVLRITRIHFAVVVRRHRTHDRRQHRHRMGVIAKTLEEVKHALVEHCVRANRVVELLEFSRVRQFTVQQEVGDFDKAGMRGELLDRVTPVHEDAFLAIDIGNVGFAATG